MNLIFHSSERNAQRSERGIALVITLLMLSVITFLAVAFLAMTRRDRAAVTANVDVDGARNMSDAALNRAQAEIVAQMEARGDALSYDYMVSRNFITPTGFQLKSTSVNNVNYDYLSNSPGSSVSGGAGGSANWAENIANLFYDPRAPVFVVTNSAYPASNDFRFWVDINRNGRFETNGYLPYITESGFNTGITNYFNGEPEWIGVLRDPLYRHSSSNRFIGRYAYMVLPIGKTLDLNYIHNWLKGTYSDEVKYLTNNFAAYRNENTEQISDGFARDEGMGSWELNLAGMLDVLSTNAYQYGFPGVSLGSYSPTPYQYYPPTNGVNTPANTGSAFADAESIVHYRYYVPFGSQPIAWVPSPSSPYYIMGDLTQFGLGSSLDLANNDLFCVAAPFTNDYHAGLYSVLSPLTEKGEPWPGSYNTNMFYDPQDLFDVTKTSAAFSNRLWLAGQRTNSEDRYTFERLLANIGTGSQPEYGVWVYTNGSGANVPRIWKTKVNLNYDNTAQITNGPYSPMPTNLVNWTPLGFFTNAADLLLRSQTYYYSWTNYANVNGIMVPSNILTTNLYFGVTNIPIFRFYYPEVQYNEAVHRMLQLAANIYSDTMSNKLTNTSINTSVPVPHPYVFQPLFGVVGAGSSNWGVDIVGFSNVTTSGQAFSQMLKPFVDVASNTFVLSNSVWTTAFKNNAFNISGIPWVVSAEKGLPQFNQYSYENRVTFTRKLLFVRHIDGNGNPITNEPPQYTNQFYVMSVSNNFGLDAWNPYPNRFDGSQFPGDNYYISNYVTVQITNEYAAKPAGFTYSFTNFYQNASSSDLVWQAMQSQAMGKNGIFVPFETNIGTVPPCYFSETEQQFIFFTNGLYSSNQFLSGPTYDIHQQKWPVHNWTVNITNHLVYALFDGPPNGAGSSALLDFVNLGPFGSSLSVTQAIMNVNNPANGTPPNYADWLGGSDAGTSIPTGVYNQINEAVAADPVLQGELNGTDGTAGLAFGPNTSPSNIVLQTLTWVANDPLVHYTLGDLTWPVQGNLTNANEPLTSLMIPLTNSVGMVSARYQPWGRTAQLNNMLYEDPMVTSPSAWQFPTNKFPSIGWLGRVHRGTPWQTVYFKSDNPSGVSDPLISWTGWVNSPDTYPTNDWALPDLFTTALNDNAARGLLSVNQTNDAAWAAVLAGVMMPTNINGGLAGVAIGPNSVYSFVDSNSLGSLNTIRTNETLYPNGLFHRIGDILGAPALTALNPFLPNPTGFPYSDEVEERIPQQIMGLLKVGEPQFVIYSWGESLRPKNIYLSSPYIGLCTNYEITGEFLTRTVCHVVHTNNTPKMVIDSYNIEPAD